MIHSGYYGGPDGQPSISFHGCFNWMMNQLFTGEMVVETKHVCNWSSRCVLRWVMGEQKTRTIPRIQSLPARPKIALGPSIFVKMGSSLLERSHQLEKGSTNKFHTFRVCKAGPVTVPQTSLHCVTFHVSVK